MTGSINLGAAEAKRCCKNELEKVGWAIYVAQRIWRGREQKRVCRGAHFPKRVCGDVHWYVDTRIAATIAITAARSSAIALELSAWETLERGHLFRVNGSVRCRHTSTELTRHRRPSGYSWRLFGYIGSVRVDVVLGVHWLETAMNQWNILDERKDALETLGV